MNTYDTKLNEMSADGKNYGENRDGAERERTQRRRRREAVNRRVEENTTTYLYAYPNSGYEFVGWQQDGQIIGTDTRFEYTMPSQHATLTALFRQRFPAWII